MTNDVWTLRRVLDWATSDFRAKGFESSRLDAELLVGKALGLDRVQLITEGTRPLSRPELDAVRALLHRRRQAEPIAYILEQREFYGLTFRIDRRVLIPRPDTETLVDVALRRTAAQHEFGIALDLCTGSGCVAIAFAKQRPTWRITASDLSADAIAVTRNNAERLGTAFGMRFLVSDLFAAVDPRARYALITANPPYIPDEELATLQRDVRDFEPRLALSGGNDGLTALRRIVAEAPQHLAPGGVLAVEINYDQGAAVTRLFKDAGFSAVSCAKDMASRDRVISGSWGGAQASP